MEQYLHKQLVHIRKNEYDLKLRLIKGNIIIQEIKKTRQRKFRCVEEFFHEVNGTRENTVDKMLRSFGRADKSIEKLVEENNSYISMFGLKASVLKEAYIGAVKEKMLEDFDKQMQVINKASEEDLSDE